VRDAPPEARALAGLAADAFALALAGLIGFAALDRYAPPQDLPWKPLSIDAPLGLATGYKLERATAEPAACLAFLRREAVAFDPVPDRTASGFCVVENAGAVGPQGARLSPAAPVMTCRLAGAFALWARQVVQPAAEEILGAPVSRIEHYGTYACRRTYGRETGRPSQHARAAAVDVAGFVLADGRRVRVAADWDEAGARGRFLHRVRDQGCRLFHVALSPDYNAAHRDHLHFDMSPYRLCR
jgi:hypothetical protein